jgi:hypothetical protein
MSSFLCFIKLIDAKEMTFKAFWKANLVYLPFSLLHTATRPSSTGVELIVIYTSLYFRSDINQCGSFSYQSCTDKSYGCCIFVISEGLSSGKFS